jgi:hypothetical protein
MFHQSHTLAQRFSGSADTLSRDVMTHSTLPLCVFSIGLGAGRSPEIRHSTPAIRRAVYGQLARSANAPLDLLERSLRGLLTLEHRVRFRGKSRFEVDLMVSRGRRGGGYSPGTVRGRGR